MKKQKEGNIIYLHSIKKAGGRSVGTTAGPAEKNRFVRSNAFRLAHKILDLQQIEVVDDDSAA